MATISIANTMNEIFPGFPVKISMFINFNIKPITPYAISSVIPTTIHKGNAAQKIAKPHNIIGIVRQPIPASIYSSTFPIRNTLQSYK